ncbi:MAG: 16S rRNA (cytosine(967)-C(5))-methyltransferase [Clostridiales bacterium]|nr:16S rRNA (cytosine(967)-C(5))-methyltransferase [Clostridiales bacterium]
MTKKQEQKESHVNTRAIVLDMLMEILENKGKSHIVIKNVLDKYNYMDVQEKAFMKRLTEGTLERKIQLDYVIDSVSNTPVNKMKPLIRNLLRMSVYQLLFMDHIPDSAVCNEAVKLAQKRKFHSLKGFVNGVLRNIARSKAHIVYPDREQEPVRYLSVLYSMPEWIIQMWLLDYGIERTERLLAALLEEHPVTVRMRETLSEEEKEGVLLELRAGGVSVERHPYLPYAYVLTHTEGIGNLSAFRRGELYVQDVSSMFVAECAGIRAGDYVLDVCVAPGGKSLHAAEKLLLAENGMKIQREAGECADGQKERKTCIAGCVEARDVSGEKAEKLQENMERLQIPNMKIRVQDATVTDAFSVDKADVLFLDIPCSGLGIMGKKRDIKYNVEPERVAELAVLQKNILRTCIPYVKKGGVVMFSTCTIHKQENEELLSWLLSEFPLETESLNAYLPACLHSETTEQGYIQFLPGEQETDGFFLARLRRKNI